jgi:Bor protein
MKTSTAMMMALAVTLSGCSTIYFDKGKSVTPTEVSERWHHNLAFGLYELSDPVDPKQACGDKSWVSVKTEYSFINWLAAFAVGGVAPAVWYPRTVEIGCK